LQILVDSQIENVVKEVMKKASLPIIVFIIIIIIFLGCCFSYNDYITDDAFISLQYAKNLKAGFGLSFNPGEKSYGFTSPLWIFILSILPFPAFAKTMSIFLGALSIGLFYLLCKEITEDHWSTLIATFIFATDPWYIRWASSGMETSLSIFFMLAGVFLFRKKNGFFPVFMGLATLSRPEIALLSIILFLFQNGKDAVKSFFVYSFIIVPYLIFSYRYFGTILPNTFLSKHGFIYFSCFIYSVITGGKIIVGTYFLELFFIIALCVKKWQKQFLLPILWCFLLFFFYAVGGMRMQSRYLLLLTPFIVLWGFMGMQMFLKRKVYIPALLLIILNSYLWLGLNRPACIKFAQGTKECFIPIGEWIKENTEKDAIIGVIDIGVIGYYSEREILDLGGLVSKEMIPLLRKYDLQEIIDKSLFESVKEMDYLVYREREPIRLKGRYIPLYYRYHPRLGLSDPVGWYYSIYRVARNEQPHF